MLLNMTFSRLLVLFSCALLLSGCEVLSNLKGQPDVPTVRIALLEDDVVVMDGEPAGEEEVEERVYDLVGGGEHQILMINSRRAYIETYRRMMDAVRRGYDRHRADYLNLDLDGYYALDPKTTDSLDIQRSRAAFPIRVKEMIAEEERPEDL